VIQHELNEREATSIETDESYEITVSTNQLANHLHTTIILLSAQSNFDLEPKRVTETPYTVSCVQTK